MEIEIITTKKKLTKSIISQMRAANLTQIKNGEVLGYVIGAMKDNYRAIIIKYEKDYYTISANYTKGEISIYRKIGKWSQARKFETKEECDIFWKYYQNILSQAEHIYI